MWSVRACSAALRDTATVPLHTCYFRERAKSWHVAARATVNESRPVISRLVGTRLSRPRWRFRSRRSRFFRRRQDRPTDRTTSGGESDGSELRRCVRRGDERGGAEAFAHPTQSRRVRPTARWNDASAVGSCSSSASRPCECVLERGVVGRVDRLLASLRADHFGKSESLSRDTVATTTILQRIGSGKQVFALQRNER